MIFSIGTWGIALIMILLLVWGTWGLSSEEKDEKVKKASIGKTILLLIITIAIGTFYYKTYQVATIKNVIKLKGVKCAVDSNKNVVDTLDYFIIRSAFTKSGSKHNDIRDLTGEKYFDDYIDVHSKNGGVEFVMKYKTDSQQYPIKFISDYSEYNMKEKEYENADHVYHFEYIANRMPSLFPMEYGMKATDMGFLDYLQGDYAYYRPLYSFINDSTLRKAPDVKLREYMGDKSIRCFGECGTAYLKKFEEEEVAKNPDYKDNLKGVVDLQYDNLNTLDLLSAADLTQCNYDIIYDIDCPTKQMYLQFDIPAVISQLPYGLESKDSYSYVIKDFQSLYENRKGSLLLHVSFPTLANMQLIRSLVLTSILTAFFSLFCLNAYYLVRKYPRIIPSFLRKRRVYIPLIIIIMVLVVALTIRLITDTPIYIDGPLPSNR